MWYSHTGKEQYFDLDNDPQEMHNLMEYPACQDQIARLRGKLIEALTGREEGHTDGERLIPGRPCNPVLRSVFPDA